jgi:hypothetical protein
VECPAAVPYLLRTVGCSTLLCHAPVKLQIPRSRTAMDAHPTSEDSLGPTISEFAMCNKPSFLCLIPVCWYLGTVAVSSLGHRFQLLRPTELDSGPRRRSNKVCLCPHPAHATPAQTGRSTLIHQMRRATDPRLSVSVSLLQVLQPL